MQNLKFLASTVREILGWSKNSKIGSCDPHMTPFDPSLHLLSLELTAFRLRAKCEVAIFNRLRDTCELTVFDLYDRAC